MALASPLTNLKKLGQVAARRYQRYRDQHGRKWGANIEIKTGDFTGGVPEPIGWTAPLMPPPKYIAIARDEDREVIPGILAIDYEAWLRDALREQDEWDERVEFFAGSIFSERAGSILEQIRESGQLPPELRRLMKGRPQPLEPIYAAMKGDPWILGVEQGDPPPYLAEWFKTKERDRTRPVLEQVEEELDPAFVQRMEAAFAEHRKKRGEAKAAAKAAGLDGVADRARREAELDAQRAADAAARRAGGTG